MKTFIPVLISLGACLVFYLLGWQGGAEKGLTEGLSRGFVEGTKDYHQRCATIGGIMLPDDTKEGVLCRGLGKINGPISTP